VAAVTEIPEQRAASPLMAIANGLVQLHKEQFGRGPTNARANFAGPNALLCVLEDALLPAEIKQVELGDANRVRDSRTAFQAATQDDFVALVERITNRTVRAFASGVDPERNVVFECFYFEPREASSDGNGALPS
jgi:uncharacterized protein YbcI